MTTRFPIKFGKYLLLEKISSGGMAEVYRAKSFGVAGFEKSLAVKRILPQISEDSEFVAMFIDEAKIAAGLHHANICQIVEFGRVGDSYFQAMEYVAGQDMRSVRNRFREQGRAIPQAVVLHVIERVCDALDYAHRRKDVLGQPLGIVHRDVSPQNILVSYDGAVKLIDFGIAKAAHRVAKTQAGQIKGKFAYLSPEQIMGQPLDGRSDIFSLGTVMWELLAGRDLFTGSNEMDILRKIIRADIPPLNRVVASLPAELESLVMQALALSPEDRYPTAGDFMEEIQQVAFRLGMNLTGADMQAFMHKEFARELEEERAKVRRFWDLSKEIHIPDSPDEDDPAQLQGRPQTVITFSGRRLMPKPVRPAPQDDFDDDELTVVMGLQDNEDSGSRPAEGQIEDLSSEVMELDEADIEEVESSDADDLPGPDAEDWSFDPRQHQFEPRPDDGWGYDDAQRRQVWDEDGPTGIEWEEAIADESDGDPRRTWIAESADQRSADDDDAWATEDGPTGEVPAHGSRDRQRTLDQEDMPGDIPGRDWPESTDERSLWADEDPLSVPGDDILPSDGPGAVPGGEDRLDWDMDDGTISSWPDPSEWEEEPTSYDSPTRDSGEIEDLLQETEAFLAEESKQTQLSEQGRTTEAVDRDPIEEIDNSELIEEIDEPVSWSPDRSEQTRKPTVAPGIEEPDEGATVYDSDIGPLSPIDDDSSS